MSDEGFFGRKALSVKKIMTVFTEEVPANFVPAAAVIRKGRVLSGVIGRKEFEDCLIFNFL